MKILTKKDLKRSTKNKLLNHKKFSQVELTFTSGEGFEAIKAVLATIGGNPKSNIVDVVDIANRALMADTNSLFTAVAITA